MQAVRNIFCLLSLFALLTVPHTGLSQASPDFELGESNGYRVRIYSQLSPVQINRIHSWELEVLDADGNPVEDASITVTGGMPDHDHGMPTNPQVTGTTGNGRYLLEGVRFHMPGRWVLLIKIASANNASSIEFEFTL